MEKEISIRKTTLKVIDLFSGAGGLSCGFKAAGFEIVAGVDSDKYAISTFARNFPGAIAWAEDLSSPTSEFQKWLVAQKNKIDVIVGGPPCQGFSIAGKRDPNDLRNKLYERYIEAVSIVKPRIVVIENVPNIVSMNSGAVRNAIVNDLELLGYKVSVQTLNASHFDVPQARRRTFFVATKKTSPFIFPEPDKGFTTPWNTFDAISDLPSLDGSKTGIETKYAFPPKNKFQRAMRMRSRFVANHERVNHTERTKQIISLVPDGGNYKNLPLNLQKTRNVNIAWTRMSSSKPSFTIDAGHNHHFHYRENRVPSVRECARIQSFPDTFIFEGTRTSQYRQVGNAVPPALARALAIQVGKLFE